MPRRIAGRLLWILGWLCVGACVMVGGSFIGIFLIGFIGTGGREAGRELLQFGGYTLLGLLVSWSLIQLGAWLAAKNDSFEA